MSCLIFYLLGVIVVLTMMFVPIYREIKQGKKPKNFKPVPRLLLYVILSWVFVAYFAIIYAWND